MEVNINKYNYTRIRNMEQKHAEFAAFPPILVQVHKVCTRI